MSTPLSIYSLFARLLRDFLDLGHPGSRVSAEVSASLRKDIHDALSAWESEVCGRADLPKPDRLGQRVERAVIAIACGPASRAELTPDAELDLLELHAKARTALLTGVASSLGESVAAA